MKSAGLRVPEKAVQAHIVQLLRSLGAQVWELGTRRGRRDYHHGTRQTPGLPDVIASLPRLPTDPGFARGFTRRRLEVEVKAAGGRLRAEQKTYRAEANAAGVDHVVGDLGAVIGWLLGTRKTAAAPVADNRLEGELRQQVTQREAGLIQLRGQQTQAASALAKWSLVIFAEP